MNSSHPGCQLKGTKENFCNKKATLRWLALYMVPKAGLEPARVSPPPPQDGVSTRFHHFGVELLVQTSSYFIFPQRELQAVPLLPVLWLVGQPLSLPQARSAFLFQPPMIRWVSP